MKTMKLALHHKALLALAAASTLMVAAPATAQNREAEYYGYGADHPYDVWGRDIEPRQAALRQQVRRAAANGQISQNRLHGIQMAFDQLDRVKATYRRGGYNRSEVNDINTRLERIEAQLRYGGRGRDRWDDRRDYRYDDRGYDGYDRDPGRGYDRRRY
jgi:hypothetical protein